MKTIATLTLKAGKAATLGDDGLWRSDDEFLKTHLNMVYPVDDPLYSRGHSSAALPFGLAAANRAAKELDGAATFSEEIQPLPKGVVS